MSAEYKIAVLPGDGIGPEVMSEALRVLDAVEALLFCRGDELPVGEGKGLPIVVLPARRQGDEPVTAPEAGRERAAQGRGQAGEELAKHRPVGVQHDRLAEEPGEDA